MNLKILNLKVLKQINLKIMKKKKRKKTQVQVKVRTFSLIN